MLKAPFRSFPLMHTRTRTHARPTSTMSHTFIASRSFCTVATQRAIMCILFFDFQPEGGAHGYRFVLAANRDEDLSRAAAPAAFWGEGGRVLSGRRQPGFRLRVR
jgi:hypothetical protein